MWTFRTFVAIGLFLFGTTFLLMTAFQRQLIAQGRRDDAIQMDINDITTKFPGKYDAAILQMIDSL